ncbi:DUF6301 family protein [Pauljensenia hongkongensis]|uniref:Uncharacterized protein n=1 Tax=Pauljensenia hongkongensis TaxID=178339 RepID=A0A1D8B1I3_9ACTO|nr:DUF6301 family protein [Pauljensenia hongkongensis]AOS46972.1 hypothetical protein BH719_03110 [Pauljensenia hongkongensis]EFW10399.1 hypothetical protein HMPREF9005_0651 [Actinomyces sp. oral taxon 178 str. F0338]
MTQRPARFEAYPAERFIEIVKAWVDHHWPISAEEGRRLFEDLGYAVDSEEPEMFLSEFASNGEADSYFTARNGTVGSVDISVTKYYNADDATVDAKAVAERYAQYCEAVDRAFRGTIVRRREKPRATEWIMRHGVLLWIGNPGSIITLYIDSPRMTRLLLEEEAMGLTDYDDILEDD